MSKFFPVADPRLSDSSAIKVKDCITSHWISSSGKYIDQFEEGFSKKFGPGRCISTSNGTVAIELALISLGIGPGDEVIVPNFTFVGSVSPIYRVHATPVLISTSKDHWNVDVDMIKKAISPKTKAIIAVHLYGHPCDIIAIKKIADEHQLALVEDCAEALGAKVNGRNIGTFGDVGCYSFFGNKVLTTGEGGMCITQNPELAEKIEIYKNHGMKKSERYWHRVIGYNGRMTNLQAAVGCGQLEIIENDISYRKEIEERYFSHFNNTDFFEPIHALPNSETVNWLTSPILKKEKGLNRDELIKLLKQAQIDTRPFFYPISCMPAFSRFGFHDQRSLDIAAHGLNLPTYPSLKLSEIDHIAEEVIKSCKKLHEQYGQKTFQLNLPKDLDSPEPPLISIILPTLNPGSALLGCVKVLREKMVSISYSYEILVMDGQSQDGSIEKLKLTFQHDPKIIITTCSSPSSFGRALIQGTRLARGQYCLFMDANGNHDPHTSAKLARNVMDYDLVSASRFTTGGKCSDPIKHMFSHFGNRLLRVFLCIPTRDNTSGYFCIKKSKLLELDPESAMNYGPNYFFHLILRAHRRTWSILEIPTTYHKAFKWPPSAHSMTRSLEYGFSAFILILKRFFKSK
jgi:perosamine synthetase